MKTAPSPHFLQTIHVENYKSLQDVTINDCNRINLFIGMPNSGKSNIIEALIWAGLKHYYNLDFESFKRIVRFKELEDLFTEKNPSKPIIIETEDSRSFNKIEMKWVVNHIIVDYRLVRPREYRFQIDINNDSFKIYHEEKLSLINAIKYYRFDERVDFKLEAVYSKDDFLHPPFGKNLFKVLASSNDIVETVARYFEQYGYVVYIESHKRLVIEKQKDRSRIPIDLALTADTLRRMIFHVTALMSNSDSILLFDEPESHAFPTYIDEFANRMAFDKNKNQFFITTHSPYIIDNLLGGDFADDVNIYIVYLEDFTTKVRLLTDEDLHLYTQYGADLFFNIRNFIPSTKEEIEWA